MQTKNNTGQIEIPEGMEIDSVDTLSGKVTFKPVPKDYRRFKTIADVLADNGLTQEQFDAQCTGLSPDEVAYRLLKLLNKSLNEGWTPDENDSDQYKYLPWFYMGGSSGFRCYDCDHWLSASSVGSRLAFKSREIAEHAGTHFTSTYKQFMSIQ